MEIFNTILTALEPHVLELIGAVPAAVLGRAALMTGPKTWAELVEV